MAQPHGIVTPTPRRAFVMACASAMTAMLLAPTKARAATPHWHRAGPHPTPRKGITAAKVLTKEQLAAAPGAIDAFDGVREIPEVVDGIRCNCGCAGQPGFYSLLSCYEGESAMAQFCPICQGEGRMAARLHKAGKTLDEIRTAIDAKYG